MKLRRLVVGGFGRLSDRSFTFDEGLNVIYGPNEAGKSTLAQAIVASLYGVGRRKDVWRPWHGDVYATTLFYERSDGTTFEVQRDFARDAKGVRVYDADGNDVAGSVVIGKTIAPGETHLSIPLEAFVNGACVLQQAVEIDAARTTAIATALARALDGGPKEDAALGAIERLEKARRELVGTPLARVNNPLRDARAVLARRERDAQQARAARDQLAAAHERRTVALLERERIAERRAAAERNVQVLRAGELRDRLEELHTYREDRAALQAEHDRYADVAEFPAERVSALEAAYTAWSTADAAASEAERAAADARMDEAERAELDVLRTDVGTLDDDVVAGLRGAAARAETARATATAAASEAAAARREGSGGQTLGGIALVIATVFGIATIAFAIAHWWSFTEVCAALAAVAFAVVAARSRTRLRRNRTAADKQRVADAALADERVASAAVAAVLDRLGVPNVEELTRRRERFAELARIAAAAQRTTERADRARSDERAAAAAFDALADELVPDARGARADRCAHARERANRRRERDGIENGIAMLDVRRHEILRGDDEFALIAERDALVAAGITPADPPTHRASVAATAQVAELQRAEHEAAMIVAQLTGELEAGEAAELDLAATEEAVAHARAEVDRLEALERAFALAIETLERITREAHQAFARRLERYAADGLATVTGGRYRDVHVDPVTLAVRVRVPETNAIADLDVLSAGTRDQIYLVVRFAMSRMFAEGLELPPLLLDDPFAFWDERRIECCLPIIAQNAFGAQTLLFTSSRELAAAAEASGATRIDLVEPLAAPI